MSMQKTVENQIDELYAALGIAKKELPIINTLGNGHLGDSLNTSLLGVSKDDGDLLNIVSGDGSTHFALKGH